MENTIRKAAASMVCHLENRAFKKIAGYFQFPAAVYFGDKIIVFHSQDDMVHALRVYREILEQQQLSRILTRIVDAPSDQKNQFTFTVANTYLDKVGEAFDSSLIQYFVQLETDCLRIRLVEYLDWPCARDIAESEDIHQLCAGSSMRDPIGAHRSQQIH